MTIQDIQNLESLARGSKLRRFINNPFKYILAQAYGKLIYRLTSKGWRRNTRTFWKEDFTVELPAGTDIYLTGGKSDDSEIRLSRFIISLLREGDVFIDIGSHFGYYSRLALKCIGIHGKVIAIEPAVKTFGILKKNLEEFHNATFINAAAGAENTITSFYEFPVLYSEYNTVYPQQFEKYSWYKPGNIHQHRIQSITVDSLVQKFKLRPTLIKIDTEGSEADVLKGSKEVLQTNRNVIIAMEYLSPKRINHKHREALDFASRYGFKPFLINHSGKPVLCSDLDEHLLKNNAESDNIILKYFPDHAQKPEQEY